MKKLLHFLDNVVCVYIGHSKDKWKTDFYGFYSFYIGITANIGTLLIIGAIFLRLNDIDYINTNAVNYSVFGIWGVFMLYLSFIRYSDEKVEKLLSKWRAEPNKKRKWRFIVLYQVITLTLFCSVCGSLLIFRP